MVLFPQPLNLPHIEAACLFGDIWIAAPIRYAVGSHSVRLSQERRLTSAHCG